jgi:hypothetical protein
MIGRIPREATMDQPNKDFILHVIDEARDLTLATVLRITPQMISVLDYTKGFGHSELVAA